MSGKRENARSLRKQGCTYKQIATILGCSEQWAWILCDDARYERLDRRAREWMKGGVCPDCGGPMTQPQHALSQRGKPHERCRDCYSKLKQDEAMAVRVQGETLYCNGCQARKPFLDFPQGKLAKYLGRERVGNRVAKPPQCRACYTAARRSYRERNKVPCDQCGKPRYHPKETGSQGSLRDTGLCRDCFQTSMRAA